MVKPQQPELGRSGHTPVTGGQHAKKFIQGQKDPGEEGSAGPVPEETVPATIRRPRRTSPIWRRSGAD